MARRLSVGFSTFGLVMLMGLMLVCVFSTRRSEAVPAGFSTFFSGKSCPSGSCFHYIYSLFVSDGNNETTHRRLLFSVKVSNVFWCRRYLLGWTELATAQGRLILSVAQGNEVGVTVNQPLAPEEGAFIDKLKKDRGLVSFLTLSLLFYKRSCSLTRLFRDYQPPKQIDCRWQLLQQPRRPIRLPTMVFFSFIRASWPRAIQATIPSLEQLRAKHLDFLMSKWFSARWAMPTLTQVYILTTLIMADHNGDYIWHTFI